MGQYDTIQQLQVHTDLQAGNENVISPLVVKEDTTKTADGGSNESVCADSKVRTTEKGMAIGKKEGRTQPRMVTIVKLGTDPPTLK